jgi:hypothetical protein
MRRILIVAAAALILVGARTRPSRHPGNPTPTTGGPTYSNEISRIFQQRCQSCHHDGDIAPFSLTDYAHTKDHAAMIKFMTSTHQMPPWKPSPDCGDFNDARVMPQNEIDLIAKWVSNGAPEGDPADLPAPLDFSGGWSLGQPDLVLGESRPFSPPATHDEYRCYTLPTNVTSDKYVSAIDVRPGDRQVVHHVIAFIDTTGESKKLDDADPEPGYQCFGGPGFNVTSLTGATLGGWAPGARAARLPENIAYSLPANARTTPSRIPIRRSSRSITRRKSRRRRSSFFPSSIRISSSRRTTRTRRSRPASRTSSRPCTSGSSRRTCTCSAGR